MLGASGAIAAVLGAYWVLYPQARILTLVGIFPIRVPAWIFLGLWFVFQLVEARSGDDGGAAFFAHIGGFVLGVVAATVLARRGSATGSGRNRWDRGARERR